MNRDKLTSPQIRLLLTCAIAVALGTILAVTRPLARQTGVPVDRFWAQKYLVRHEYDVVFGGDSRVTMGISTREFADALANFRLFNFAFFSSSYNQDYLDAIEGALDPSSQHKVIFLGITPLSLTPAMAKDSLYTRMKKQQKIEQSLEALDPGILYALRVIKVDEMKVWWRDTGAGFFEKMHEDGWVESYLIPEQPDNQLEPYRRMFENSPVSSQVVEGLMKRIRAWRSQNIQVYGFRPPISQQLRAVEDQYSGFEEQSFRSLFARSGAIWLQASEDQDRYHCYDGCHLEGASARLFSQDLAKSLANQSTTK